MYGSPLSRFWWAWLVIAVYAVGFTALAAWIFARRDITD
jgi:ABC-type transport system involved in multi-copper enzyme maturation permease subunit